MSTSPDNFDRLAGVYRALEFVAFGRDLERARFAFIAALRDCRSILTLGEGDGRFLARLVAVAPQARITCIDSSAAMLARAAARLAPAERERVTFLLADIFKVPLPPGEFDGVTTLFFLDCFEAPRAADVVTRIRAALRPRATWLFADFVLPAGGVRRLRARIWLAVLYTFFRWQTGLRTRALPPSEKLIAAAGLQCTDRRDFQFGFVRSAVFNQPGSRTCSS